MSLAYHAGGHKICTFNLSILCFLLAKKSKKTTIITKLDLSNLKWKWGILCNKKMVKCGGQLIWNMLVIGNVHNVRLQRRSREAEGQLREAVVEGREPRACCEHSVSGLGFATQ